MSDAQEGINRAACWSVGKTIASIQIKYQGRYYDDVLVIEFNDGSFLNIWYEGHVGFEERCFILPDDINQINGGSLLGIEVKDLPGVEFLHDYSGCDHYEDAKTFEIKTSKDTYSIITCNEHNGRHGGSDIIYKYIEAEAKADE